MAIPLAFALEPFPVPLAQLLPSKKMPEGLAGSRKYKQIRTSIEEIGLIEPLSVAPAMQKTNLHLLLDGHIRLLAIRELGHPEAPCLVATDDESYTYNNRVNRLSTIQEHFMLRRAVARGVSPERLAKTLGVDVKSIAKKVTLLDGICPEATELLRDRQFTVEISRTLRKMKPTRQVECVELMIAANSLTVSYAEAMLAATPVELLVDGKKPRRLAGVTQEQILRMEREMANVQGQYKMVEQTYGQDVLHLVLARTYIAKLLENQAVVRHLKQRQSEVLAEFGAIVQTVSLDQ